MIDPLSRVSVRIKLALLFVSLCLIAYGLGGSLVSRWTETALEREILARLDSQCRMYATALDASLQLLERRLEDFASDGYIRDHAERLQATDGAPPLDPLRADLRRHLIQNKLPLVDAFECLAITDVGGELLAIVPESSAPRVESPARGGRADATRVSGILGESGERLELLLSTPLHGLDGSRDVGHLHVIVSVDGWLRGALANNAAGVVPVDLDVELLLHDGRGRRLVTTPGVAGAPRLIDEPAGGVTRPGPDHAGPTFAPVRGTYARSFPVSESGWWVEVTLSVEQALLPVSGLKSRLLGVGVVLAIVSTLLLFFPMRFVVRPLVRLTRAAERLSEGELDTRVEVESSDEIGELGRSFNGMADAIQERTHRLERSAADLRERQAELRAERDRVEVVIASMHDGLVVLDGRGEVVLSNSSAQPLLALIEKGTGATSHNVCKDETSLPQRELGAGADDDHGCFACLMETQAPPRSCAIDVGARTFEIHTTPLPPDELGRRGRVLVSREVTDRVKHDERQIHNERLAVLGEVAAVVAHEINNPLASISMFNQMLEDELEVDSALRENTEVISRNIDTAKRAIRELLDYATGATPEVGPLDVHDVLHDVQRFLRPLSERAGVSVQLELSAAHPGVTGDEIQLRQVFVNLTLNAIQAVAGALRAPGAERGEGGAPGSVSAERRVTLRTSNGTDELFVDVEDTGPGISPDECERVFRPFFTTKSRGEGTGLGLPTARRIAEMHGGGVEVIRTSLEGTTMRVRLRARSMIGASA